jgi:class 3 adenylate cyclase/alpha-beta hydrolase superfamily lysophospholipase
VQVPEVFFAEAGDVRIAWQQFGSGPDVVTVPPLVSNVEIVWEHEFYRRYLEYIARFVRVTAFDKRGIGLSDRFHEAPTLEQRTDDVRAVMDSAGLDRVALFGQSEGGLIAQLFTAMHPERVELLVLVNSVPGAAATERVFGGPNVWLERVDEIRQRCERLIETWGRDPQYFVDWYTPCHSANAAFVRWMGRLQRQSATAADLRRQMESIFPLDAADQLAEIDVPTLILHATGDPVIPVAAGAYLAERIPGARFVAVPGEDHFVETTPYWRDVTDVWLEFVTGSRPPRHLDRRLATVLFTDIVDSTARTTAAGDANWRNVLDAHDRLAWEMADRHRGTIVKNTGDGVMARFEAPSSALAFSMDFRRALDQLDLPIRCGIHTGEIEVRADGDITGTAVNVAARVQQAADDGDIFVSSTVRDMLLGGDLRFTDEGEHRLKGLDNPWHLFALVE